MTTARPCESLNDCRRRANIAGRRSAKCDHPRRVPTACGKVGRHLSRRAEIGSIIALNGRPPAAIVRFPALC